jgi:heme exporter protein C
MNYAANRTTLLKTMTYLSAGLFAAALILSMTYPGPERSMGEVQRIFYLHLGTFFGAFTVFLTGVIGGIAYLRTSNPKWDTLGVASVEIGLALSAVTIVTGAVWAHPIWGTYWTWDPRLTTVAIMWLTYAAYMFLRNAMEDPERRMRFAAVYNILAFGSVLLTIIIIRVRPDVIHPVVAGPSTSSDETLGDFGMTPRIAQTVLFNIFAYVIISLTLLWHRIRLENRARQVQRRKMEAIAHL